MVRKLFLILLLVIGVVISFQAQNKKYYFIYSVAGDVRVEGKAVDVCQRLSSTQKVVIDDESQLTLFDEGGKLMYCLNKPGEWRIDIYIRNMEPSIIKLTANFLKYVKNQLFGEDDGSRKRKFGKVTTVGYRGEGEDEMFLNALCVHMGTIENETLQRAFVDRKSFPSGDYFLTCELVSHNDGSVIENAQNVKNPYYVRVTNHTPIPLFVNILNVDQAQNFYLLLRPDAQMGFSKYLIPGNSTVSFLQQTLVFRKNIDVEHFILVGAPFPVDFSLLEQPVYIEASASSEMKVGIYRLTIKGTNTL